MAGPSSPPLFTAEPSEMTETCETSCPACGQHHRRIQELEAQVELLNARAAATAAKLARYEDEVQALRSKVQQAQQVDQVQRSSSAPAPAAQEEESRQQQQQQQPPPQHQPPPPPLTKTATAPALTRLGSLSSLLSRRKTVDNITTASNGNKQQQASANPASATPTPTSTTAGLGIGFFLNNQAPSSGGAEQASEPAAAAAAAADGSATTLQSLQGQLDAERTLRLQAEADLHTSQLEIEELTTQLFGEANEMVAQERQARARLEQRLQTLEERDRRRGETLDRLETRIKRVERVRGMLGR